MSLTKERFQDLEELVDLLCQDLGGLFLVDMIKITTHIPGTCLCAGLYALYLPCWICLVLAALGA